MRVKFYTQFSKLRVKFYTQRSSLNACNAKQRIRLILYLIAELRETRIGLFPRNRRGHFKLLVGFGKVQAEIRQLALARICIKTTRIVASLKYEFAGSFSNNTKIASANSKSTGCETVRPPSRDFFFQNKLRRSYILKLI